MPRNRLDRTRDAKTAELVAIAQTLFLKRGYEGTTIAAIAREAGIASNVVHWYFPTKDDLFVAALDSLQSEDLREAQERLDRSAPGQEEKVLEALLTEFVWRRLDRYGLIATLHERSHFSSVVAEFHEQAHRRYAAYLRRAIDRCPIPDTERKLLVEALIAAAEGLVMHRASRREAEQMMTFLSKRLIPARRERPTSQKKTAR